MNGQQTLLQKAKSMDTGSIGRPKHVIDSEMIELALAWCKGEVREVQIRKATGITKGNFQNLMLKCLRQYALDKELDKEAKTSQN